MKTTKPKKRKLVPKEPPAEQASAPAAEEVPKRKRKRVEYSLELGELICERVALGETLTRICEEPGMPDRCTVFRWRVSHADFLAKYQVAWQQRAEARADRMDEIMGEIAANNIDPQAGRVILENLRWQAAKEHPKQYGERSEVNVDHSHNHLHLSVQDTTEWIAKLLGGGAERPPPKLVSN